MIKLYNPVLVFFMSVIVFGAEISRTDPPDSKWNGTVSLVESEKGPDIIISEWKIEGTFQNSMGPVVHSSNYQYKDGVGEIKKNCLANKEGRVEVIIDQTGKLYTIMVHGVPDCIGKSIEYGVTGDYRIPGGDTVIYIPDQPMGANKDMLTGTITLKNGPSGYGIVQSHVFKWNLTKAP